MELTGFAKDQYQGDEAARYGLVIIHVRGYLHRVGNISCYNVNPKTGPIIIVVQHHYLFASCLRGLLTVKASAHGLQRASHGGQDLGGIDASVYRVAAKGLRSGCHRENIGK